ncbi:MAG TPA: Gfo/Idh/MocA family oxidoreductase [Opitutaceae bacterium]|nr:Gfo/Idh/MocA family oxidoreductase [Opitutaceae bacterium]
MAAKLSWGILATGRIAGIFARGIAASHSGQLVAVGSRAQAAADRFAREFGAPRAHGSYAALLEDRAVEAVYVATPHPLHAEWAIRAMDAGKHVLCEKPLTMDHATAARVVEAARTRRVLLMEAFMYRCHPQTAKIVELVRSGALGRVGLVQATFGFQRAFEADARLWNRALGGGGILDVGCYPVSLARLVAGAAEGRPFADPVSVTGAGWLHPETGVDVYAAATLKFANGIVAQVACGIGLDQDNSARIYGSEGWLHVPVPWAPCRDGGTATIALHRRGAVVPQEILITAPPLFALEADAFAAALAAGQREAPPVTLADTLGNMATLDQWRAAVGVAYPGEGA